MVSFNIVENPAPAISLDVVRLSNGVTLHYASQGPRTGPAVIMIHGYSDSWFSFSRVLPLLPPELRVIAPDMRGHGDSERPLSGYRIADMADDVIRLMDALNIPKAVLIGHSMGVVRGPRGVRAGAVPDLEAGADRRCAHGRQRRDVETAGRRQ